MNEEFDILELVMSLIEQELNIPCFFMFCEEDLTQPYVIFKINNEKETGLVDNENICERFSLEITLWYTQACDYILYKKIKKKLVENNFKFVGCYDLLDESSNKTAETVKYFGKLMDFTYTHFIKE